MSLLDKATIITTPTAHSNGTLHSIKGGAVADFDVVRGSAATRVSAEGLIEDISTLSEELVSNGDFVTDLSGWNLTGINATNTITWEANGARFVCVDANIGFLQNSVLTIGKKYKFTCNVSVTTGAIALDGATSGTTTNLVDGYNEIYFTAAASTFKIKRVILISNCLIDNISVVEVIDATNIPRIDYTTGEGVVLLEPQSTNLITYSEDFSNAAWTTNSAVIESTSITLPNGLTNGQKLFANTSSVNHWLELQIFPTASIGEDYTMSMFVKSAGSDFIQIAASTGFSVKYQNFNISTGTKLSGNTSGSSITDFGNGWFKISVTEKTISANARYLIVPILSDGGRNPQFTGTSNQDGVYIFGAQLEALSYATSYIPTTGAIATRLADAVTGAGDATTFNSTEGVLYAEIASLSNTVTSNYMSISDGTYNNRLSILFTNGTNVIRAFLRVGGVSQVDKTFTVSDITEFHKVAFKYKENDFALWIDGVEVSTDTNGSTIPSGTLSELSFSEIGTTSATFQGKVKALAVFNEALTDVELECLTTI